MTFKKIQDSIERFLDKCIAPITYSLVITAIMISFLLVFFPKLFPDIEASERVGLSQLAFEAAGVSALILAANEFSKKQRKPILDLWISEPAPTDKKFSPVKSLSKKINNQASLEFRFHVVLENYGESEASWIRVNLQLATRNNQFREIHLKHTDNGKFWSTQKNENKHLHIFNGRSDYQITSHPREGSLKGECDSLGIFHLLVAHPSGEILLPEDLRISYEIQSHEIDNKIEGEVVLKLE